MSGFTALAAQGMLLLLIVAAIGIGIGWSFGALRAARMTSERYEQQLRATLRRTADAEADVVTLRAQLDETRTTLSSTSREQESQEHLLAALEARLAEAESAAAETRMDMTAPASNGLPASIHDVIARTTRGEAVGNDDLTKIKGIGQVIAKTLKGIGITSYIQIARLTDEDIDIVEDALEAFRGRIRRDDWMSSAAELAGQDS